MKIGIDASSLVYQRGVSRYTSNLIKALAEIKDNQLYIYGSSARQKSLLRAELKKTLKNISPEQYDLFLQSYPPSILAKLWRIGINPIGKNLPKIDLFHSWDWLQPPDKDIPLVSTIHDLAIIKYPEVAHPKVIEMHQRSWEILKKRKAQIIAVSQATKMDIIKYLEIPEKRVHVVHEALPTEIKDIDEQLENNPELAQKIEKELAIDQPYILFVGNREPRKNLERLIKAWKPLSKDYQLIIAGEQAWDGSEKISKNKNLRFLGRVSDLQLAILYYNAEIFAYPSLDEGFGLPVLEAFSYGVPVLTSDIPVMREIAGNAAELVDPKNIQAITAGLEKLLNEKKVASEKRLKQMIIRLQLFNWQKTARKTMAVYQKAIEERL
jgi:glycosyltransferase involved in cell wall biosynthesis